MSTQAQNGSPQESFNWDVFTGVVDKLTGAFGNVYSKVKGTDTPQTVTNTQIAPQSTNYYPLLIGAGAILVAAVAIKAVIKS